MRGSDFCVAGAIFAKKEELAGRAANLYNITKNGGITVAKMERIMPDADFDKLLSRITEGILGGSMSASLEDASDFRTENARCAVRVFERYSWAGGNRVSLSVTLFAENGGPVHLSAITAGGSQAMFFKVNTFGEEAFLDKLAGLL